METEESWAQGLAAIDELESRLRLDIYIIDSGWKSVAHKVLEDSMDLIKTYLSAHNLYILTPEQSIEMLRSNATLVGKDPIVMVVDRLARALKSPYGFGARILLGHIQDEHRVEWLIKMFLRLVNSHAEALDMAHTFQQYNHKEGVKGAIEIIMESFGH